MGTWRVLARLFKTDKKKADDSKPTVLRSPNIPKVMEISQEENFTDIYNRLVEVSEKMEAANDPDVKGFNKALFLLHRALKSLVGINLHLENTNLKNQLLKEKSKTDIYAIEKTTLFTTNAELIAENKKLKHELKSAVGQLKSIQEQKTIKHKAGFTPVEISFEEQKITFLINTNAEKFNEYFTEATNFVYSRRKKRVELHVIKGWYMEYYKALGFTIVSK